MKNVPFNPSIEVTALCPTAKFQYSLGRLVYAASVTAKLFCHRNCSPKLSKNIKKLLPIMPSITAHMSYLFWSPKEKRLVHPTRDVNWRRFQEDFEEILEA